MPNFLPLALDDVPLVVEALRAYAPHLDADAAVESDPWLAQVFADEAHRAGALSDALLNDLRREAEAKGDGTATAD